jgi:hypothetical protein
MDAEAYLRVETIRSDSNLKSLRGVKTRKKPCTETTASRQDIDSDPL